MYITVYFQLRPEERFHVYPTVFLKSLLDWTDHVLATDPNREEDHDPRSQQLAKHDAQGLHQPRAAHQFPNRLLTWPSVKGSSSAK